MADLKTIKIFLASSIVEFDRERDELQTYIARLNKEYMPRGIYFDLEVCENVTNALALSRKQDEYNDIIRQSRYVYLLVGERIGQYTEEEFDVALDQFRKTGTPLIYTYFKRLPEGEEADQSVAAFMQRLGEGIGHYWSEYSDLDSIKLNIILELMRDPEVGGVVQFEDGRALLNGEEMVSLENVPIYSGNDNLQATKDELDTLNEQYTSLRIALREDPDNEDLLLEFASLSKQRSSLSDQIHQMEMAVLDNMNLIASASRNSETDARTSQALGYVNDGKYADANIVLSDPQWRREIENLDEVASGMRAQVERYLFGQRLLIANLKSMGVTSKSEFKIIEVYERAREFVLQWHVGVGILAGYAAFLRQQRKLSKAAEVAQDLIALRRLEGPSSFEELAEALLLLARIQELDKDYVGSESSCIQATNILENTSSENEDLLKVRLALAYRELGFGRYRLGRLDEALETLQQSEQLLETSPLLNESIEVMGDVPRVKLATTYNRLALVSAALGKPEDAENYHRKAVAIREKTAESGKPRHLADLAISYTNLAKVLRDMGRLGEAVEYCQQATDIRRKLADDNPAAYAGGCIATLEILADLWDKLEQDEKAKAAQEEAESYRIYCESK